MKKKNRKNAVLYPCTARVLPLIRYLDSFSDNYQLTKCVVLPGSGLDGQDISCLDNRNPMGYFAESALVKAMEGADVLLIPDIGKDKELYDKVLNTALRNVDSSKTIVCAQRPSTDDYEINQRLCFPEDYALLDIEHSLVDYFQPKAKVVFVGGMLQEANVLECALTLIDQFRKKGLKVSGFGWPRELGFIGLHSYAPILDGPMDADEKIRQLKYYFLNVERVENPDIIVVQLPGVLFNFGEQIVTGYGVETFTISQAIPADLGVLCINADFADAGFIELIQKRTEEKFDFSAPYIHLSNVVVDGIASENQSSPVTFHVSLAYVEQGKTRLKEKGLCVYNILLDEDGGKLAEQIIKDMTEG